MPDSRWLDDKKRASSPEKAFFGYEQVPMTEKDERVLAHFNSIARRYDMMNSVLSFGIHHLWKRRAIRVMRLAPGQQVLDVCGGTGDLAVLSARYVGPEGRVTIFDINQEMLKVAAARLGQADPQLPIDLVHGNAEHIAFEDSTFDAVTVGYGIRNVTRMEKAFREMFRVLKPGGQLMCLEFSKPSPSWFRWLYDFYSFRIMPIAGQWLAGSARAYRHLSESIRSFPLPDELADLLRHIGFADVTYLRLTRGISVIHRAFKPKATLSPLQDGTSAAPTEADR